MFSAGVVIPAETTAHLFNGAVSSIPHVLTVLLALPLAVQRLCDYVCDLLLEESNVQPVSTPVTVCGDIHGQVGHTPSSVSNKSLTSQPV